MFVSFLCSKLNFAATCESLFLNGFECDVNPCCTVADTSPVCQSSSEKSCQIIYVNDCDTELCFVRNNTCVERLPFFSFFDDQTALLSSECHCTVDGFSGGVQTGVVGCTRHESFASPDALTTYCYVQGGAASRCPCTEVSAEFPGAAYRICSSCVLFYC